LEYRQFPCDFINTAAPSKIELSDDKTKLTITHLEKDGLTEVAKTFEIKVNSPYISFFEKSKEFNKDWHHVVARLPVISGIGNVARSKEINAEYDENCETQKGSYHILFGLVLFCCRRTL
jgi:hypothetical protein